MKLLPLAGAVFLLSASFSSFAVSMDSMNKSEAQDALSDKTMTTISAAALNGKIIPNSFTGYFGKDGKMSGGFATKPDDASQYDKGSWQVKDDGKVCVKWDQWFDGKEQCVYFYKLRNALLIINADKGFESVVLNDDVKAGNQTMPMTQ